MSTWFDRTAKRAALAAPAEPTTATTGLTRRQALIGGAVATGVAWTAPALLSATPAWAVASCPNNAPRCGTAGADGLKQCCPNGTDTCPPETNVCTQAGQIGGNCTNNGEGTSGCANTSSTAIACNGVKGNNICGGVGARCNSPADCAPSAPFCKGTTTQNKVCSTTGPSGP